MRRLLVVVVVVVVGTRHERLLLAGARDHDIDAGLKLADRLQHREGGRHVLVELARGIHRAGPNFGRLLVDVLPQPIGAELRQKVVGMHGRQKIAVADTQNVDGDPARVDRDDRNAFLPDARQHVIAPGEAHLGRAVADIDVVVGGL